MKSLYTAVFAMIVIFFSGCASTEKPIPISVLNMKPSETCTDKTTGGWDIQAQLIENDDSAYIIINLETDFKMFREPSIQLKMGYAIYKGNRDTVFYYEIGKIPKSHDIGRIIFQTPNKTRMFGMKLHNENIAMRMERQADSNCLKLTKLRL